MNSGAVCKFWLISNLFRSYHPNVAFEFVLVVVIALFVVFERLDRFLGWIETTVLCFEKGMDRQVKNSGGEWWIWLKNVLEKIYQIKRDFPARTYGVLGLVWASDFFQKQLKI